MDDMNNQRTAYEDVIDLADLFRTYVKKWHVPFVISFVVAVLVFAFLSFFYNKGQRNMSSTFAFEYPGIESGFYPDGTTFNYTDLVSADNITGAVALDTTRFAGLDAEELIKSGSVSVKENYTENKDKEKIFNGTYTITLHNSSFNSKEQAKAFAEALLENVKRKISNQANQVNYHTYLDSYTSADTFEDKLAFLKAQQNYLTGKYTEWIEAYGEQYTVAGKTLVRYKEDANLALSTTTYNSLSYELKKRQYVYQKEDDQELVCKLQIELLNDEYEDNAKKIDSLAAALAKLREGEVVQPSDITGASNETAYYEKIAELTERQVDIEREITNLNTKIKNINLTTEVNTYLAKMDAVAAKLDTQTTVLEKTVAPALYSEKTVYNFRSGFTTSGGFSSVVGAGVAFVVMYLVVGFFVFIMKDDEEKKKENA